jgi:hypothetical protein
MENTENTVQINTSELKDLLKRAKSRVATDWEREFVREQIERFKRWGEDLHLSPKQLDILQKIARREVFDDEL